MGEREHSGGGTGEFVLSFYQSDYLDGVQHKKCSLRLPGTHDHQKSMNTTFACDMNALSPDQRRRHGELAAALRPAVAEIVELPHGYTARFSSNIDQEVAEFCELELLCCPFFELELSRYGDASELSITGPGDIKPFIRAEFGIPGPDD